MNAEDIAGQEHRVFKAVLKSGIFTLGEILSIVGDVVPVGRVSLSMFYRAAG